MDTNSVDDIRQAWVTETNKTLDPNAQPQTSNEPQKFVINAGGREYAYESKQQYEQALSAWNNDIQAKLRAQEEELARYRAEMARLQQPQTQQQDQGFDNENFYSKLAKNGLDGMEYALQNLILGKYDPNIKIGTVLAAGTSAALKGSQDLQSMQLEKDNPHIQWHDPKQRDMIEQARKQFGKPANKEGYEDTIGRLTMNGYLKTRQQWQQEVLNAANPNYADPVNGNVTSIRRPQGLPSPGYSTSQIPVNEQMEATKMMSEFESMMANPKIPEHVKEQRMQEYRDFLMKAAG